MPWYMTPFGPQYVIEPGTIDEFERRDYVSLTTQQAADYFAGVAFPDPPSFVTEAELAEALAGLGGGGGTVPNASTTVKGVVELATNAETTTGTDTTRAVTPAGVKAVIGATGGGSGVGIDTTDVGYDVVLLLGQSNMAGAPGQTFETVRANPSDTRVWTFDSGGTYADQITRAVDPLHHQGGADGVGPGVSFGRWFAARRPGNRHVLLVPCAFGGTPLTPTTGTTWNPATTGSLYDEAVTQAQAALAAAGPNARFAAVLWHQGESDSDAGGRNNPTLYRDTLDALIANLRADLSSPALPFIIGGLVPEYIDNGTTNQALAAVHADTPNRIACTGYAAGPTGMHVGDQIHFTPAGARELGRRMAAAYIDALANTSPPGATPPTAPGQVTGLVAGTPGQTSVPLSWNAVTGATSYTVERSTDGGSTWTATTGISGTSTTVTGLTASTAYEFRVAAVNSVGTGTYSATATATTSAAAPVSPDSGPALTTLRGTPTYSAGKIGNAMSGGVLSIGGSIAAPVGTIELWMKVADSGATRVAIGNSGPAQWIGVVNGAGGQTIELDFTGGAVKAGSTADSAWHHVAGTFDGTNARLFIDGALAGTTPTTATLDLGTGATIGGYSSFTQFEWPGQVDEVRVSKVVRYTGAFTPPTTPFTADADTLALYHLNG